MTVQRPQEKSCVKGAAKSRNTSLNSRSIIKLTYAVKNTTVDTLQIIGYV